MATNYHAPYKVIVTVTDPVVPLRPSESNTKSHPTPNPNPGSSTAVSSSGHEVLQEFHLHYNLFLQQHPGTEIEYTLALPLFVAVGDKTPDYTVLSVYQHVIPEYKEDHTWNVRLKNESATLPLPMDGGPPFREPFISQLEAQPADLNADGTFDWDNNCYLRIIKDVSGDRSPLFQAMHVCTPYTMLEIVLAIQRRFSKQGWNYFSCKRVPAAKSTLLEGAARTADLILVGGEGVEAPAHSAVLVDIPYFEARLRDVWSGNTAWNLHNKLRLELPTPVQKEALDAFLKYVYGDTRSLYKVEPSAGPLLQDILSLADACGVPALCTDVIKMVRVTSANVDSWLAWLLQEHGVDASPIKKRVVRVMKDKLQNGLRWNELSVEQLSSVAALQKSLAAPPPAAPETGNGAS